MSFHFSNYFDTSELYSLQCKKGIIVQSSSKWHLNMEEECFISEMETNQLRYIHNTFFIVYL